MFDRLNKDELEAEVSQSIKGSPSHRNIKARLRPDAESLPTHLLDIEQIQESILLPTIKANDWRQEMNRVDRLLKPPQVAHIDDELDDFHERQRQVTHHLKVIKDFTYSRTMQLLDYIIETANRDLRKIAKREGFLTQ